MRSVMLGPSLVGAEGILNLTKEPKTTRPKTFSASQGVLYVEEELSVHRHHPLPRQAIGGDGAGVLAQMTTAFPPAEERG